MEGFIEVNVKNEDVKVLLPLSQIQSICEDKEDGSVFIETGFNDRKGSTGVYVKESFAEIRKMIAKLILFS